MTLDFDIVEFGLSSSALKKKSQEQNQTNYEKLNTKTTLFFYICFTYEDHTASTFNMSLFRAEKSYCQDREALQFLQVQEGFQNCLIISIHDWYQEFFFSPQNIMNTMCVG